MADDTIVRCLLYCFCALVIPTAVTVASEPTPICGAPNYDVRNLTARVWKFMVPSTFCLQTHNGSLPSDGCEIQMAFCRNLNESGNCFSASVCENYSIVSEQFTYKLGSYVHQPFNVTGAVVGQGFHVSSGDGQNYTDSENKTCSLKTVMTFICNKSAIWEKGNSEGPSTVPINPDILFDPVTCLYNFTFHFAGACPLTSPSTPVHTLSPGSVLLLIFFVSLIVYFALGSLVNTARGKHGQEIIPHNTFWTSLPVYIADGCEYSLSCGRRQGGQKYESI